METKEDLIRRATPASWWKRLSGWFIDYLFGIPIITFLIVSLIGNVDTTTTHYQILVWSIVFLSCIIYYCCEWIFGRTLGKLLTGTVVVDSDTFGKPSFGQVLGRTFCRFIPFDAFTFISSHPEGWHDSLPSTMVVTKSLYEKINAIDEDSQQPDNKDWKVKFAPFRAKFISFRANLNQAQRIILAIIVPLVLYPLTYAIALSICVFSKRLFSETWYIWVIYFLIIGVWEYILFADDNKTKQNK
ncbi:MAG: RDD family protein [Prevotella sp.]|nr:RDD family protein [Prevotella sp.]